MRPAPAWFLRIDPVRIVGMLVGVRVCPRPRLFITSGVIWTPYDWLNKFYRCYNIMATVVVIVNGRGLGIATRRTH